jgi:RNA polymerase sigma-70 factor (ECF subfamily)
VQPDEDAVVRIYRETIRPLYRYVSRRVGGNAALAEDLVQETWMRALDTWPSRGIPDEPIAWLMRVAHNTMVSHFRRVRPDMVDIARIDLEAPAFTPDSPDDAAVVSWGLAHIRRGHALVLEAFYFEGKSVREIARDGNTSERGIEGRLRRARLKLKKVLDRAKRPPAGSAREWLTRRRAGI